MLHFDSLLCLCADIFVVVRQGPAPRIDHADEAMFIFRAGKLAHELVLPYDAAHEVCCEIELLWFRAC